MDAMRSRTSSGESSDSMHRARASDSDASFYRRSPDSTPTRRRSAQPRVADEPSILGSIGKLVRLALLALVLAMVVPYIKTRMFGSTSSTVGNATRALKNPYSHAESVVEAVQAAAKEPDVFNFKHQDYLRQAHTPHPSIALQPKPKPSTTSKAIKPRPTISQDSDGPGVFSQVLAVASSFASLLVTAVQFILVPFRLAGRAVGAGAVWIWSMFRVALSHVLRPLAYALAPLSYLVSGILYVFVHVPLRVITTVATELYPVYIFLGAASVVGITMGIVAAAVLYLTAFIFVDRIPPQHKVVDPHQVQNDYFNSNSKQSYPRSRSAYPNHSQLNNQASFQSSYG
ncbi:hypothetical protein PANT_3d00030 [Moesziomyces antarcticus T-34]|uniref:Uncharacterized protein n=1 Tax=Pseudozyma antarctica (strain T-34) TaxID=1151754 RepID=M9LSU6_PSEA3|nr:hypothetical protein PANT_3d00030 [Moesziomyces antarcticus T-34]